MSRLAVAAAAEENPRSPSLQRSGSPPPLSPPPLSPLPLGVPRAASVGRVEENPRSGRSSVSPSPDLTRSVSPPPPVVSRPPAQAPRRSRNRFLWRLTPRTPKNRVRGAKLSLDLVHSPPRRSDAPPPPEPPPPPPQLSGDSSTPPQAYRGADEEIPGVRRRLPGSFDPNPL